MSGKYQLLPPLSDSELAALRDDIQANGVRVPIDIDEHGEVLDGHHRKAIAIMLGIDCPERVIKGMQEFEKVDYALTVNLARRHLDRGQRRELVIKSLKRDSRLSDREHARRCGVDHKTVGSIRSDLLTTGEIPQSDRRLGGDGRERPATNSTPTGRDPEASPETSAVATTGQPEEDRRDSTPGDEDGADARLSSDAQPQAGDVSNAAGSDETGTEDAAPQQSSGPVDLPQEQPTTRVSVAAPAGDPERSGGNEERGQAAASVPAPPRTGETDDERAEREEREYREARSLEFATGLVNVRMRLEPDPVHWYKTVYVPGLYHARNLPRVKDSFTPTGMRQAAGFLLELADHLDQIGEEL